MSEINSFSDYASKYNTNVDYSYLFGGMQTPSTGSAFNLSDYAAIKNGSYGKLLKAYYAKQDAEKASSGGDTVQKSTLMKSGADALKKSADALNNDELWEKKKIKKKDATNLLKFTLIELVPQNCKDVMGGEVNGTKWEAPSESVSLEGSLKILCGTGQTVEVKRMTLDGAVRGKIGGDDPLGIECEMEMMKPLDGSSPFSFDDTAPFISVTPTSLSFVKGGEKKTVDIEASGAFSVGKVPAGFSLEVVNGRITITADANTGAVRNGTVEFTLAADNTQKATLTLSQAAGNA